MNTSWSRTDVSVLWSAGWDHPLLLIAHTDLNRGLAIAELLELDLGRVLAQAVADALDQLGVRRP